MKWGLPPPGAPWRLSFAKSRHAALPLKGGGDKRLSSLNQHMIHHNRQAEWSAAIPPVRLR